MLAIDTNIIVRYLTGDHPQQSPKARALIDAEDVFVSTTVLLETEWVLRGVYGLKPVQVARALGTFAGLARVMLEDAAPPEPWIGRSGAWISPMPFTWRRRKGVMRW